MNEFNFSNMFTDEEIFVVIIIIFITSFFKEIIFITRFFNEILSDVFFSRFFLKF